MHFVKYFLCLMFLLISACVPKEQSFTSPVLVSQSKPIQLKSHKVDNASVYVLARRGEVSIDGLQSAVEQSLRQKGYKIAEGPSSAGYIIHITVPSIGTFSSPQLQSIVSAGYGKPATPKSHVADTEKKFAMVADVLIVARQIPEKVFKRPEVVSTTSKPSKVAEDSSRIMAALNANDDQTFNAARPLLVKEIANKIVSSLP